MKLIKKVDMDHTDMSIAWDKGYAWSYSWSMSYPGSMSSWLRLIRSRNLFSISFVMVLFVGIGTIGFMLH